MTKLRRAWRTAFPPGIEGLPGNRVWAIEHMAREMLKELDERGKNVFVADFESAPGLTVVVARGDAAKRVRSSALERRSGKDRRDR